MDTNKKDGRNENSLIRMSADTRDNMGFYNGQVELWPSNPSGADRLKRSVSLKIFRAFSKDNKELANKLSKVERCRVGFVTTKTFNKICNKKEIKPDNIWISTDIHDTVIGADPEFLLFDENDEVINASNVIEKDGCIGSDGAMIEIRPQPEVSVDSLVENMEKIFDVASKKEQRLKKYKWLASCYHQDNVRGYPVGGHIHVGNPIQLMKISQTVRTKFYSSLNKIMDEYLSVPASALDGEGGVGRRSNKALYSGFGYFGEFRTDLGRLEHRTLSGMWLIHPSFSRAVLGTAKAVIDETFKLALAKNFSSDYIMLDGVSRTNAYSKDFKSWGDVPITRDMKCTMTSGDISKILNESDCKYMTRDRIKTLHNKLKGLSTYKENSKYIDGFCEILRVGQNELSKCDREIRNNWLDKKKFIVEI